MADGDPITVNVDVSTFRREISDAEKLSRGFGRALGDALEQGVVRGRSLTDVLRGLGARLSSLALSAALRPLENAFSNIFSGVSKGLLSGLTPMAKGGVLNAPAVLSSGGGFALAGEAGPEAVLPLSRGADGRLGVASSGGGAGTIVVNIATPDVEGFRRSEAQLTASLARAVARGRRGL